MKIVIGMSGGIDSSVAAALLKKEGHELHGVTLRLWRGDPAKGIEWYERSCCKVDVARAVAQRLGIQFTVVNIQEEFEREIIDEFCKEYISGRTPNPCIRCNEKIKFGLLLKKAKELGAERLATGHYARVGFDMSSKRYLLKKGVDPKKDQSYFLYRLKQEQLKEILFPLGEFKKEAVWKTAKELDLAGAEAKESQEICFVTDAEGGDYRRFIEGRAPEAKRHGDMVDTSGNVIGRHEGIAFYTIGQRRGLGISSRKRLYVVDIDSQKNRVVLGNEGDLLKDGLIAKNINLIAIERLASAMEAGAKIRYRNPEAPAIISPVGEDKIRVRFKEPQRAIAKGQSVVFYDKDVVIGGGIIS
ncbi:MAG: tRNA 2-thiouridine(34) synthase MnmA [Nitrospirae bacterium]|nr:tRNA 2-thiouridine(34) synthase MnmA [Nitrospirota bacterium]